jgi:hypothetical protein
LTALKKILRDNGCEQAVTQLNGLILLYYGPFEDTTGKQLMKESTVIYWNNASRRMLHLDAIFCENLIDVIEGTQVRYVIMRHISLLLPLVIPFWLLLYLNLKKIL